MNIINLITEKGLEYFQKKDPKDISSLNKGIRTLIQTHDEKEYLGIFLNLDNKKQSLKLQSTETNIIIDIPLEKTKEIHQSLN